MSYSELRLNVTRLRPRRQQETFTLNFHRPTEAGLTLAHSKPMLGMRLTVQAFYSTKHHELLIHLE